MFLNFDLNCNCFKFVLMGFVINCKDIFIKLVDYIKIYFVVLYLKLLLFF